VRTDLGIEQTLKQHAQRLSAIAYFASYWNIRKAGGNNLHTSLVPLIGHSPEGSRQQNQTVTGFPFIREPAAAEHSAGGDQ